MQPNEAAKTEMGQRLGKILNGTQRAAFVKGRSVIFSNGEWSIQTTLGKPCLETNDKIKSFASELADLLKSVRHKPKIPTNMKTELTAECTLKVASIFDDVIEYQVQRSNLFIKSEVNNNLPSNSRDLQHNTESNPIQKQCSPSFEPPLVDPFEWRRRTQNEPEQEYYPEAYDTSLSQLDSEPTTNNRGKSNFRTRNAKRSLEFTAVQHVMKQKFNREI